MRDLFVVGPCWSGFFAIILFSGCGGSENGQIADSDARETAVIGDTNSKPETADARKVTNPPSQPRRPDPELTGETSKFNDDQSGSLPQKPSDSGLTDLARNKESESADANAGRSETKKRKKRVLGPPAEPTGETGTELGDFIPEIEGKDVDGEFFASSDYEGKVMMIDFWGDW
ncbi:MAG: hypothetical protein AAGA30_15095 [Planctomycetota bacterium]